MADEKKLSCALLGLRLSVFLAMLMWTLDKFVRPPHAMKVFEVFNRLPGLGAAASCAAGGLEALILVGFLLGFRKRLTYGAVLLFHGVSTLSSYRQYLAPYEGVNLLFFAAWPMLAACLALYLLRDDDTRWTLG